MSRADPIAAERHGRLLRQLRENGVVRVDSLSREFAVSPATIRRDLLRLEREGLATRVFGGAVPSDVVAYGARTQVYSDEKQRIADRAAALVSPGETIALDPGTTVVAVAERLRGAGALTVATNSVAALLVLEGAPEITTIVTGGVYDSVTRSLSGPLVERFYEAHRVDKLFIGAGSVGADGLRDSNVAAMGSKRAAIASATQTIVVADHSKFERNALVLIADWSAITALVTDREPPHDILEIAMAHGVRVWVA